MEALMDKMPGMGQISQSVKNQMMGSVESKKMIAIINSMTPKERTHTKLTLRRTILFGRYCLSNPLAFSFCPLSHE
jgi:signal recognition particle GTPase